MKLILMAFILCLKTFAFADENLRNIGMEAQDYALARDYDKAAGLYEQVLKSTLPPWQKAITLYNLGTVKLAQNKNEEAIRYYQQIPFDSAGSPQLIRSIYLNKGIAYLNQASESAPDAPLYEYYALIDLYENSLHQFNDVLALDCQLKTLEGDAAPCQATTNVGALITKAKMGMEQVKIHLRQSLLKSEASIKQISSIDEAKKYQLPLLLFDYQLALLADKITEKSVQQLLQAQKQLTDFDQEIIKSANADLEKSLVYLQKNQADQAKFFLLAAFDQIEVLNPLKAEMPADVLSQAWMQAHRAKELTQLSGFISDGQSSILQNAQQKVIKQADDFLPAVLTFEKKAFESKDKKVQRCQKKPWDQVLPLFDKGYLNAQSALTGINQTQTALILQTSTLVHWQEALRLLSQSSQNQPEPQEANLSQQDIDDLLRRIQEMQAEDQPQEKPQYQELHSW